MSPPEPLKDILTTKEAVTSIQRNHGRLEPLPETLRVHQRPSMIFSGLLEWASVIDRSLRASERHVEAIKAVTNSQRDHGCLEPLPETLRVHQKLQWSSAVLYRVSQGYDTIWKIYISAAVRDFDFNPLTNESLYVSVFLNCFFINICSVVFFQWFFKKMLIFPSSSQGDQRLWHNF